jgi:hypothetical protein
MVVEDYQPSSNLQKGREFRAPAVHIAGASMPRSISVRNCPARSNAGNTGTLPPPKGSRCSRVALGHQGEQPAGRSPRFHVAEGRPSSHDGAWPFVHSATARGGEQDASGFAARIGYIASRRTLASKQAIMVVANDVLTGKRGRRNARAPGLKRRSKGSPNERYSTGSKSPFRCGVCGRTARFAGRSSACPGKRPRASHRADVI